MLEYDVTRRIDTRPDRVWAVLVDAPAYPTWSSGVTRVEGVATDGGKLTVHSEVSPGRAFPVRVALDPAARRMTWTGGMPLGLFRGVRTFTASPDGDGTLFHMREVFSGPLTPLMARQMPDLTPSFEKFADGLRVRSEEA